MNGYNKKGGKTMNTCFFCKGTLEEGFTTHVCDVNERAIIVRGVPCLKCNQCSEVVYDGVVYETLENIVDNLKKSLLEIAIANYKDRVA